MKQSDGLEEVTIVKRKQQAEDRCKMRLDEEGQNRRPQSACRTMGSDKVLMIALLILLHFA